MSSYSQTYNVTVHFAPKGTPPEDASEIRSVTFTIRGGYKSREDVYDLAREEVLSQNILSKYALENHWTPYRIDVVEPAPPNGFSDLYDFE